MKQNKSYAFDGEWREVQRTEQEAITERDEAMKEIQALESKIETLEGQVEKQKAENEELRQKLKQTPLQ